MNKIYTQYWVTLKHETRLRLAKLFGMIPAQSAEVVDNVVVRDAYPQDQLDLITVDTMQKMMKSKKTDIFELLKDLIKTFDEKYKISKVGAGEETKGGSEEKGAGQD